MAKTQGGMSIPELRKELARQEQRMRALEEERGKLVGRLAEVERELTSLAGAAVAPESRKRGAGRKGAGRRGRKPLLTDTIAEIVREAPKPVTAGDIAAALTERRFRTRSKNLANLVREALTRVKGIKRVARGLYAAA